MDALKTPKKGQKIPPPQSPESRIVNMNNRLRLVEEKTTNLNRKIELIESNMIATSKKTSSDIKTIDSELLELKREIDTIKQKFDLMVKELKMTAGREELTTLQHYLDLWNPSRFVTREEIDRIIDEKIEEKLEKAKP